MGFESWTLGRKCEKSFDNLKQVYEFKETTAVSWGILKLYMFKRKF
jgi:hypothetical protein